MLIVVDVECGLKNIYIWSGCKSVGYCDILQFTSDARKNKEPIAKTCGGGLGSISLLLTVVYPFFIFVIFMMIRCDTIAMHERDYLSSSIVAKNGSIFLKATSSRLLLLHLGSS
jgi:hypothetical protein